MDSCRVLLNGVPTEIAAGTAVPELVRSLTGFVDGVAVAVNGEVVAAVAWPDTTVRDGDEVDVVTATQGG